MKKLIIDVENTTTELNEKYIDYSPYNPNNKLVSIGWKWLGEDKIHYIFVHHNEINKKYTDQDNAEYYAVQDYFRSELKKADIVIAHNAKYDVQWLEEAGFDLSHLKIEDTMIREYVMARGRTDISFRLADTCKRYKVAEKGELFEKYPDLQISEMPIAEVEEYGRSDIQACAELYLAQSKRFEQDGYQSMHKTVDMMNEFCRVLASMERAGVKIDEAALNKVEADYIDEAEHLKFWLHSKVKEVMGDTPINLESPQQLSAVIYSRRLKPGKEDAWVQTFNIGRDERNKPLRRPKMGVGEFVEHVKSMTDLVLKTEVKACVNCEGVGTRFKTRKDGTPFKKAFKCKVCFGEGVVYIEKNEIAGFRFKPRNVAFTTVNGFSTNQVFLEELLLQTENKEAKEFIEKLMRLSSVSSYLSTFVGGIRAFKQYDNILHPNYNQCITATGRLSSTKPNLQNQPREATFPIRKVFVSRFEGGEVTEVDFKQLEFRAAVHLAQDKNGKADILNGSDIHNQTADIITENGQPIERQDAKSRTFKPLFGGVTGTEAERAYYRKFTTELYPDIGEWHKQLEETAIAKHMLVTQTGRQFIFPDVTRAWHGGCTRSTQVKNFPVQSFATADLLPMAMIRLQKEIIKLGLKSVLVLTTHDSCAIDTYPDEKQIVIELASQLGRFAEQELRERYGIEPYVPFDVETKAGFNLMEMKKVA